MSSRVHWITVDVNEGLPAGWQQDVGKVATDADFREFPRTPILSREATEVQRIPRGRVDAAQVRERLPWLYRAYREDFLDMAAAARDEPVAAAKDDRYGVVLDVQRGSSMRLECHIDANPLTGVLFCTDHATGGELVFAHDPDATDIAAVEQDCSVIRPHSGHLIFFDARRHPHYARPLKAESDMRVVTVMNYYTGSCPESTRPRELNRHLYGDDLASFSGWRRWWRCRGPCRRRRARRPARGRPRERVRAVRRGARRR